MESYFATSSADGVLGSQGPEFGQKVGHMLRRRRKMFQCVVGRGQRSEVGAEGGLLAIEPG
ncbi:hypothetical protein EYF80_000478 [Liparis tanakae]|uniref:Uncharacterized protein n=1 Tax=Liparis tanakae TaxID=230148 RepID=A0A4Z2JG78_9TELE|nr:hypothetical protein EYF80_000478 [Liparis tanakae]